MIGKLTLDQINAIVDTHHVVMEKHKQVAALIVFAEAGEHVSNTMARALALSEKNGGVHFAHHNDRLIAVSVVALE